MEDALIRHRIKDILMDQIRMSGGKKRRSKSKTTRGRAYAGSKTAKKRTSRSKSRVSGSKKTGHKRTSKWIAHVKKYAKDHNISYAEALKKARASYKPEGGVYAGKRRKTSRSKSRSRSKSHVVRRRRRVRKAGVLVGGKKRRTVRHKSKRAGARVAGSKSRRRVHHKRPHPHIDAIISEFM